MLQNAVPLSLMDVAVESAIIHSPLMTSPSLPVRDAIARMSAARATCQTEKAATSSSQQTHTESRASCILVIEDQTLVGILTERDIVRLAATQETLEHRTVGQFMAAPVITLHEEELIQPFVAINLLQQHGIRHLPIVDSQDQVIGIVTHSSLQQLLRPVDLLRLRLANEVMTTNVVSASPNHSVLAIANLMASHQVSSVVLTKNFVPAGFEQSIQIPVGIITERDIVQFQALELDFEGLQAHIVMSSPVFTICSDSSLWDVQKIMQQQMVKRLVVTGTGGELVGIVTQTSVLKALNPLDLYRLAETLEQKVSQLEEEKVTFLQERNQTLETQVQQRTAALGAQVEREQVITKVATRIHSSLNLQEVLESSVQDVRSLLNCSHIWICQFQPDWSVIVVAESHAAGLMPNLDKVIFDPCFAPNWVEPYLKGRIRVVEDIETVEMTECHRQLARDLNIRAKILVPIVQKSPQGDQPEGKLWGLLSVIENDQPRQWTQDEVSLVQQLTTQLSIAIQKATAYESAQTELTERQRVETDLRLSQQRYESLAEASPVGIFRTNPKGECIYVNEQWMQMMGISSDEGLGRHWAYGIIPQDRDRVLEAWSQANQTQQPLRIEVQLDHQAINHQETNASPQWVFAQVVAEHSADQKTVLGYVGTITDISDRKRAEQQLLHNALHDSLTNLPNRTLLMQRLDHALSNIQANPDSHFAVLFLDLDQFKVINDSLGHLVGDEVLLSIAQLLSRVIGKEHLAARLGGDEFVILLEHLQREQQAIRIAEDVLVALSAPVRLNHRDVFLSASIGIVWGTSTYTQPAELIRDADIAMYRAKANGRNQFVVFTTTMHSQAMKRLDLGSDLQKAIENQEFRVVYQPIVSLGDATVIGFEALVRWLHPHRGMVSPGEFIPLAEETGLVVELDRWVRYEACRQLAQWQEDFPQTRSLKMSVNLSVQDLRQDTLVNDIAQMVKLSGLPFSCLNLEVTESMVMEDIDRVIAILSELKQQGLCISIDDFGTGYSSLSYLHQLPADILKIDRSFVGAMQIGQKNYQIVETIVALGQQLGLATNAEGIETQQQLEWLQTLGCETGQGYLFAKPLSPEEITPLLRSHPIRLTPSSSE